MKCKSLFYLALAIFLCACAPKSSTPETFAEMQLRQASAQCQQEATSMNPEAPFNTNPIWSSYYTMCMNRFGYSEEQINKLWY